MGIRRLATGTPVQDNRHLVTVTILALACLLPAITKVLAYRLHPVDIRVTGVLQGFRGITTVIRKDHRQTEILALGNPRVTITILRDGAGLTARSIRYRFRRRQVDGIRASHPVSRIGDITHRSHILANRFL
jgi:hypothetical protein